MKKIFISRTSQILIFISIFAVGLLSRAGSAQALLYATLAPVNLTTNGNTSSGTSYTTASVSPGANALILATIQVNNASVTPNDPTISGNGLTWVEATTTIDASNHARMTMFRAMGQTTTPGTITFDFAGQTETSAYWAVTQFNGASQAGTNGSGALVQTIGSNGCVFAATRSITFTNAFSNLANATYGVITVTTNGNITPGNGYTEISETDLTQSTETEWRINNSTTASWNWTGSHCEWAIAAEIAPARLPVHTFLFSSVVAGPKYKMIITRGRSLIIFR